MLIRVAIIGPHDLVRRTGSVAREFTGLAPLLFPYRHEREAEAIVRKASVQADAYLFTGPIPFYLARRDGLLDRPAAFISLTGASLFRALLQVQLDQLGDIRRLSIDTLTRRDVEEAYRELGVPTEQVQTKEYAGPVSTQDLIEYHRQAWRARRTTIAITCLRSAYEVLRHEQPAYRLVPTIQSIRVGLRTILLQTLEQLMGHAQVAMAVVDVTETLRGNRRSLNRRAAAAPGLKALLIEGARFLGGTITALDDKAFMIVTTRGALERVTDNFSRSPFFRGSQNRVPMGVKIGIGLGKSAREAQRNARFALARGQGSRRAQCFLAFDSSTTVLLPFTDGPARFPTKSVLLARRLGMSSGTITRLRALVEARGPELTAQDVADSFRMTTRSARRILDRLCVHGVAVVSRDHRIGVGRPRRVYRTSV